MIKYKQVYEKLSIIRLVLLLFSPEEVLYFSISRLGKLIIKLCKKTDKIKYLHWQIRELRSDKGEIQLPQIYTDIADICSKIKDDLLSNDFIGSFNLNNVEETKIYLMKVIGNKLEKRVILINVVEKFKRDNNIDNVTFVLSGNLYEKHLYVYALGKQVLLKSPKRDVKRYLHDLRYIVGFSLIFPLRELFKTLINKRRFNVSNISPAIAAAYNLADMTLDRDKKSALSLFLECQVDFKQIMLIFNRKDAPCTDNIVSDMDKLGMRYVAMNKQSTKSDRIPLWSVTPVFFVALFKQNIRLASKIVTNVFMLKSKDLNSLVVDLFKFNSVYAYYYDYYQSLNVKVFLNPANNFPPDVPKCIAIRDAGGVYICFQLSDYAKPYQTQCACADVYFSFGPYYNKTLKDSRSLISHLIYSGYITDYSFQTIRKNPAKLMKQQLKKQGVEFTISFYDEAIGDAQMSLVPMKTASSIHDLFAKLVLDSPDIAVIHKPKRVHFSSESKLLIDAIATNRYLLLKDGQYNPNSYPAEAALASDLSIGLLFGGTTVLESIMAGVPSFYLDLEKLYSQEEYKFGKDVFVFDNLEKLKEAILAFKNDRTSLKYPEVFTKVLQAKDPFQDGKAINRIGDYLFWLLEKFNAGEGREVAMDYACNSYAQKWGTQNIIREGR
ncbi:MAG: hypothetical protein ACUZ8I_04055 [Candidatus Scalindua sp.]